MLERLKRNTVLIISMLIILSPIIYINRSPLSNIILQIQDKLTPIQTGSVDWLSTKGNQIIDDQENPVLLRGVNIASNQWSNQYKQWHPSAVKQAASVWNANIIRTRIFERDYITNPLTFFRELETEIINPAREAGVYVILHPWLGENVSLPTKHTKTMWTAIAKRYQNDPTIIYDILAEPRNITFEELRQAYTDLIPAIREVNPKSLIMVTGLDWGRDINLWENNPLPYDNIVYRTNPYNKQGELEGYFLRLIEKYPVFLGEYGSADDLTMKETDVDYLIKLADTYNLGWTAWNFSASGCPCLLSDENNFTPSDYGNQVFTALNNQRQTLTNPPVPQKDPNKFIIYSDFLDNGFTDYSWDILRNLTSTDAVYQGNHSLLADYRTNGGLYLHSVRVIPKDKYRSLIMHIHTSRLTELGLKFRTKDDDISPPFPLAPYTEHIINNWYQVRIPSNLIPFDSFSSLMIEPEGNTSPLGKVYFDNLYLE